MLMQYMFNSEIAEIYGVDEAIINFESGQGTLHVIVLLSLLHLGVKNMPPKAQFILSFFENYNRGKSIHDIIKLNN